MRITKIFIQTHGRNFFVGLFFAIMLQGCPEPLIKTNVVVDMGAGIAECSSDKKGVGACTTPMSWSGSAGGFWHDGLKKWLPMNTPISCRAGSNKCRFIPGDCQGINCISRVKNVDASNKGDCYCGCPPL